MKIETKINQIERAIDRLEEDQKPVETVWYRLNMTGKTCPLAPGQKCPMEPGPGAGIVFTFCENCSL
ncbi:MAG: hypothetical protein DRQ24_11720 [Candidatus Latescibacterota bacterium]|nr:MAG: hypothetical protein DRQ24_11720 [Candidatus Latescibacterota bacterium]